MILPSCLSTLSLRGTIPGLATAVSLVICSCSSPPTDYPKTASRALATPPARGAAATLEREAARHPGKSGFSVIKTNHEAFRNRVALADFAQETLDVQYYIWTADTAGLILGDHLVRAAERGVRVRFLLDDINFKKSDSAAAAVSAHPNIEVRIFNPHRYRSLRALEFGANFARLNKRMHNKIMVMDNACAIIGGRNIADEYFGLHEHLNFRDLDITAAGPIVREISDTFDEFWNSAAAVPIEALVKEQSTMDAFHRHVSSRRATINPDDYPFPLDAELADLRQRIGKMSSELVWARGEVLFDSIESLKRPGTGTTVFQGLGKAIRETRRELLIEQAYFVLRDNEIASTRSITNRGVRIRVLTNSLASNDVIAAQSGHSRRRAEVLDAGIDLYEFRPDAAAVLSETAPDARGSIAGLHTKALVFDDDRAFVGSYNLDPRSAEINSEIGLLVHSKAFARQVRDYLEEGVRPENAYHVTRNAEGRIQWETVTDGQAQTWTRDPATTFSQRFMNGLFSLLPIEDQL